MLNLKNALCTQCLQDWGFHAKSAFFFTILVVTCTFLLVTCLSISQTIGEGTIQKMFVGVLMETWQVSLDWEHQVNSLANMFTWGGLAVRGNYVWCLALVTKYKGLEGFKVK